MEIDIHTGFVGIMYRRCGRFKALHFTWEVGAGPDVIQLIKV